MALLEAPDVGIHHAAVLSENIYVDEAVRRKLQTQLKDLRSVLVIDGNRSFLDLFDEFVDHHEFELALHTLFDFILESDSPRVTTPIVDQIQHLHASMKPTDSCVKQLRKKIPAQSDPDVREDTGMNACAL